MKKRLGKLEIKYDSARIVRRIRLDDLCSNHLTKIVVGFTHRSLRNYTLKY